LTTKKTNNQALLQNVVQQAANILTSSGRLQLDDLWVTDLLLTVFGIYVCLGIRPAHELALLPASLIKISN